MNPLSIEGKSALITGAGKGVGKALVKMFLEEGCYVTAFTRSESDIDSLEREFSSYRAQLQLIKGDVAVEGDVAGAVEQAVNRFGSIDMLINNAGIGRFGSLEELTIQDYDDMMNTNMRGTFLFTKAVLPIMKEQRFGHIVNISSVAGKKGLPNETIYCATKFAQVGFAQALDHEVRPFGIKVSSVCPGGIHTHFAMGTGRTEGDPRLEEYLSAEDVAMAVRFIVGQHPLSRVIEVFMRPMAESI